MKVIGAVNNVDMDEWIEYTLYHIFLVSYEVEVLVEGLEFESLEWALESAKTMSIDTDNTYVVINYHHERERHYVHRGLVYEAVR